MCAGRYVVMLPPNVVSFAFAAKCCGAGSCAACSCALRGGIAYRGDSAGLQDGAVSGGVPHPSAASRIFAVGSFQASALHTTLPVVTAHCGGAAHGGATLGGAVSLSACDASPDASALERGADTPDSDAVRRGAGNLHQ